MKFPTLLLALAFICLILQGIAIVVSNSRLDQLEASCCSCTNHIRPGVGGWGTTNGGPFPVTNSSYIVKTSTKPNDYSRGVDDALNRIALVNLEARVRETNWNFGQMSEIVRKRIFDGKPCWPFECDPLVVTNSTREGSR